VENWWRTGREPVENTTENGTAAQSPSVAVGRPVKVNFGALPGETLTGRVTDVAAVSHLNRGDVTYTITIALQRPRERGEDEASDLPLRWGMTAFVNVEIEDKGGD